MVAFLGRFSRDFRALCFTGCVERVRELLAEDPGLARQVDQNGNTPLWWLPEDDGKAEKLIEALLKAGADPTATNKEGTTAAEAARRRGLTGAAARLDDARRV